MSIHVPPPSVGRRVLRTLIAALAVAVLLSTVGALWELLIGRVGAGLVLPALGDYLLHFVPSSVVAGLLGGVLGTVSRWLWSTSPSGTAAYAGIAAAAVGLMVTFMLLFTADHAWLQILWILLIGLGVGWASLSVDRAAQHTDDLGGGPDGGASPAGR